DQLAIDAERRTHDVAGLDRAVDDESEVALDRLERRQLEHRLGARRLGLRLWNRLEQHFEADQRTVSLQCGKRARMQFAEPADDVLRPHLDSARAARMQPGWAAGDDL